VAIGERLRLVEITIVAGDIVQQDVDAVVNAANSGLMGGGGVDGAILRAGGPDQHAARKALVERIGSLPTGEAAACDAGAMPAQWVIHVVGPVWSQREDRRHLLESCYRNALAVADELGARSVAFPAVSAGIYGWPIDDAADVAVRTVATTPTDVEEVRFVLFTGDVLAEFERAHSDLRTDSL
jgi:O-acetyl-ADP-ribose deacetylase